MPCRLKSPTSRSFWSTSTIDDPRDVRLLLHPLAELLFLVVCGTIAPGAKLGESGERITP